MLNEQLLDIESLYDALGQLIRADDPHEQATWKYYYDLGGNITKKEKYVWPDGAASAPNPLGEPTKTVNYGYNDPNWKDKLTSYDGKEITYNEIGNPLTFDGWTYTRQAGRQLAGMSKDGKVLTFKYDHNGLRTQKNVVENGISTTYDYTLHGKLITHLNKRVVVLDGVESSEELYFFYDTQSRPAFVEYSDVPSVNGIKL